MDRRQSIKAVARSTAMGGTFQAAMRPVDVLTMDDIAERWASYSGQPHGMSKSHLIGFVNFILDQLARGYRLDFGLVSFYPRLSGGLTSRDADPEADGLFVRGHILKSDTALVEVVFDEAVPKGTYLLALYTRSGRGTDFKVVHCRSEVMVK